MADKSRHDFKIFWGNFPSRDRIFFVDSVDSEEFGLFCWSMNRAFIVGMDSEWKPSFLSKNSSETTRVSILQIACRIYDHEEHQQQGEGECNSGDSDQEGRIRVRVTGADEGVEGFSATEEDVSGGNLSSSESIEEDLSLNLSSNEAKWRKKYFEEVGDVEGNRVEELVFVLDLLELPLASLCKALKSVFASKEILKLGFKFKQDLKYLAESFPGEEASSCFDKVDPYIDIGKIYSYLQNQDFWLLSKERKMLRQQNKSLSTICEEVLGVRLSKDLQCSDWEQRPLTDEQMAYAAADAYYLLRIFDVVHQKFLDLQQDVSPGDEMINTRFSTAFIGLKELLLPLQHDGNQHVLRTKPVLAENIIKGTIKGSLWMTSVYSAIYKRRRTIPFCDSLSKITQILGERILLSESKTKTRPCSRKGRRRLSLIRDNIKAERTFTEWQGPPPWDLSFGGDGIPRFLCDVMVEGLAKQLRCVGIDAASPCVKKADPRQLVEQAQVEKRILLTRDTKFLRRHLLDCNEAYLVKNHGKQEQLVEVIKMFNLQISEYQLMSRCIKCNGEFIEKSLTGDEAVVAATSEQVIPIFLRDRDLEFWQCSDCQKIYWEGTQYHNAIQQFSNICKISD